MRVIGLTGGIGTGKSEVSATLRALGAEIIDADAEAHSSYRQGTMGWRRLLEMFGDEILGRDGEIDRRKLGQLVFGSPQALAWLNAAIHPLVRDRVSARLRELSENGTDVAVVDAALLYEAGWDDLTDEVWAVTAPPVQAAERLVVQRGLEDWEAQRRIDAQSPPDTVASRADVVIENAGTLEQLRETVTLLWNERILSRGDGQHGGD
ncbi:MAG: dephospho-CoA kinase [Dehalococcoidia bacterium]